VGFTTQAHGRPFKIHISPHHQLSTEESDIDRPFKIHINPHNQLSNVDSDTDEPFKIHVNPHHQPSNEKSEIDQPFKIHINPHNRPSNEKAEDVFPNHGGGIRKTKRRSKQKNLRKDHRSEKPSHLSDETLEARYMRKPNVA